ncbi:hypothetical protein [Aliikangiella coralliicola]|uniref:Uncharacterized protein n=1 Tax=Aliikangiella coralliicola TaxID=2592383 RepID=A0A545U4Y6_9GAMM|nr:hypothetical protein [Aliikangiella coralliicola]TQV84540.1 hypothetical protein FLL46_23300 [Aliikangiella coralliicola]
MKVVTGRLVYPLLIVISIIYADFLPAAENSTVDTEQEQTETESQNSQQQDSQPASQNRPRSVIEETVLGMNVSGNKELPNVLYIIPWKANATQALQPQVSRLVDEIYAPVDPEVFSKQVKFYYQLTSEGENSKIKSGQSQDNN